MFLHFLLKHYRHRLFRNGGALAGLVGITAGADVVSVGSSIVIGGIAGCIVVLAVLTVDKLHLDDPVGALSVHLVCGIWGTLAVGIFSKEFGILPQLAGAASAALLCFPAAFGIFYLLKVITGIRVSEQEELQGLDIGEHSMEAYSGFQIFITQ